MAQKQELSARKLRALIVDDNADTRELLRRLLRQVNIDAETHADGAAALAAIEYRDVDFILSDLAMTPMDGIAFVRALRASSRQSVRKTPVIIVTAHTERHQIELARDAGADAVLAKPVAAAALYDRIREAINHPRPFVAAPEYAGPDRRHRRNPDETRQRRKDDAQS
jgi:two-component system chemotaxis response regulator CheY